MRAMRWKLPTRAAAGLCAVLVLSGFARADDSITLKPPPGVTRYQPTIDEPVAPDASQTPDAPDTIVLRPPPGVKIERVSYEIGGRGEPALRPSILDRAGNAGSASVQPASVQKASYRRPVVRAGGSILIQVGAYREEAEAARRWNLLMIDAADALSGMSPRIVAVDLPGRGRYYRLRAGPLDKAAAAAVCRALKEHRHDCIPVKG